MKEDQHKNIFVYEKIKQLGEGAFGTAYLVFCKQNQNQYVIKSIKLKDYDLNEKEKALTEAKIINNLNHPNIIMFNEVFIAKKPTCTLNIVTEYLEGGDLSQRIKRQKPNAFKESQILDWIIQISLALYEIHDKQIIHRDIKPSNCFLTKNGMIKLGDFGISKPLSQTTQWASTQIGTPYYMAPEIKSGLPYSYECDIWSLGILLYQLMTFTMPFTNESPAQIKEKLNEKVNSSELDEYSIELRQLLKKLLTYNPIKRSSAYEILTQDIFECRINALFMLVNYDQRIVYSLTKTQNKKKDTTSNIIDPNTPLSRRQATQSILIKSHSSVPNQTVDKSQSVSEQESKSDNDSNNESIVEVKTKPIKTITLKSEFEYKQDSKKDISTEFTTINKDSSSQEDYTSLVCQSEANTTKTHSINHRYTNEQKDDTQTIQTNSVYNKDISRSNQRKPFQINGFGTGICNLPADIEGPKKKPMYNPQLISMEIKNTFKNKKEYKNEFLNDQSEENTITIMSDNHLNTYKQNKNSNTVSETLPSSTCSMEELIKELGKQLFNTAYNIISDNFDSNSALVIKGILKANLQFLNYSENKIAYVMQKYPGLFYIVSNDKQRIV